MRVLVIGGAGYIGSHVTYELCDQGYITVLDNLSTGFIDNIDKELNLFKIHLQNADYLTKILKNDCVIHLAALKAAGDSMVESIKYSKSAAIDSIRFN